MKKLSNFLDCARDAEIQYTHYANSALPKTICFVLTSEFLGIANNNENIAAVITTNELAGGVDDSKGLVISLNPKKDFFNLHNLLIENGLNNIEILNSIDPTAIIADTVKIYGNVQIGKNVTIEDFVVINSNTIIEDNTYIAQNVTLGARGMHNTTGIFYM